jgi:hypothetical protein
MPDTFTPTLNLTKVEINGSSSTWGQKLNANADKMDTFATTTSATLTSLDSRLDVVEPQMAFLVPRGGIIMWSGSVASVPAGWALCNGANGTPDLRDRFVIGAGGTRNPGATGGAASGTTSSAGAHTHTGSTGGTALTEAQMPSHQHGGTTSTNGDHNHQQGSESLYNNFGGGSFVGPRGMAAGGISAFVGQNTSTGGAHNHTFTTDAAGGGQAHIHTIGSDGAHTHTVDTLPPFLALAFIMKL